MTDSFWGEPIFSYSRKQAIEDGVLIDLSHFGGITQAWKHPIACTASVWSLIQSAITNDGKGLTGILWDISHVAMANTRIHGGKTDTIRFKVAIGRTSVDLKLHVGPGDTAEPVLTLMLPHED